MSGGRAAAGALVVGAVAAVAALLLPGPVLRPDPGPPCAALVDLDRVLDLDAVGDQTVVRARAAALADALATRAAGQDAVPGDARTVQQLLGLLEDPGATVADLVAVVEPVAENCDIVLQAAGTS